MRVPQTHQADFYVFIGISDCMFPKQLYRRIMWS